MADPSLRRRTWARHALAGLAILCTVFAGLCVVSVLAAGTIQMDGDYPHGAGHLLLSSLAPVHFHGILPADGLLLGSIAQMPASFLGPDREANIAWQVKMSLFLNAFGYEWPDSPTWDHSVGIVRNVDGVMPSSPALRLPGDLADVGRQMGLDREDHWCLKEAGLDDAAGRQCAKVFFSAWCGGGGGSGGGSGSCAHQLEVSTTLESMLYYILACSLIALAAQELVVRVFPKVLRCACPGVIRRRGWCPCWKEDVDGPVLTHPVRNRMRLSLLKIFGVVHVLATGLVLYKAYSLKQFVDQVDEKLGDGMQAGLGLAFFAVSCATWVAVIAAVVSLKVREGLAEQEIKYIALSGSEEPGEGVEDDDDHRKNDLI
ncbi:hypothetical protein Micbo1qcDRAFT_164557 [Microdochium bolleyi]|uniref:SUR7/PalI family-domain-containing protein n=1 Tax=Microdochium bolleyi TaxID=196109 RepID=A0A136IYQ2_9PEZI|nr:hypothetical protein Micbo1qcDRAFT_164557 [Microdochium bolleyi]